MILHITPPNTFPKEPRPTPHAYTPHTHATEPRPTRRAHTLNTKISELIGPWIDVHTLVVEGVPFPQRMVVRSVLVQRARTQGPRVGRTEQITTTHVASHTSLTPHSSHIKYINQVSCASQYFIINEPCINASPRI